MAFDLHFEELSHLLPERVKKPESEQKLPFGYCVNKKQHELCLCKTNRSVRLIQRLRHLESQRRPLKSAIKVVRANDSAVKVGSPFKCRNITKDIFP